MASSCFFVSFLTIHSTELRQLQSLQNVKSSGFFSMAFHVKQLTYRCVFYFTVYIYCHLASCECKYYQEQSGHICASGLADSFPL